MKISNLYFLGQDLKVNIRSQADKSVFKEIFELREYKDVEAIIKSAQAPIIDAGAQAGFFSLYCRSFNKTVLIYAIEPEEDNFLALEDNLKLNNVVNVELVSAALSAKTGLRDFYVSADTHNHGLFKVLIPKITETKKVKSFSLADFLQANSIAKVSLLKLDIEGAEHEVLANFNDWQKIKALILEYHDFSDKQHQQLEKVLKDAGYKIKSQASKFDKSLGYILAS